MTPRAALALVLLAPAIGCGHAGGADSPTPPEPVMAEVMAEVSPAPAPVAAPAGAQVIVFDGDEPEAEPTTLVRSAPKRAPIPAFQLFGTRAGDGP